MKIYKFNLFWHALSSFFKGFPAGQFALVVLTLFGVGIFHAQDTLAQEAPKRNATNRILILPLLDTVPEMDGKIDEGEWDGALNLGSISHTAGGEMLPESHVWVTADKSHLYVAVRNREPRTDKIKVSVVGDEIKGPVWVDDSVEIFLDPYNTGEILYQLVVNTEGTLYDGQVVNGQANASRWVSNARVRTHVGADYWDVEVAIPMLSMGHSFTKGEVIGLNVGRNRYTEETPQHMSFAGNRFAESEHFVPLLIQDPIVMEGLTFVSTKRGPFSYSKGGVWEFRAVEGSFNTEQFKLEFPNLLPDTKLNYIYEEGDRTLTVSFTARQVAQMNQGRIRDQGKTLFDSTYQIQSLEVPQRFEATRNPLFEELLESRPDGLSKKGILIWAHELDPGAMKRLSYTTGREYIYNKTPYERYRDFHAILFSNLGLWNNTPILPEKAKTYGIPLVMILQDGIRGEGIPTFAPNPSAKKLRWLLDPRATRAYLDDFEQYIQFYKEHDAVQWVAAGDETWERMHRTLLLAIESGEKYPELAAADQEIREKYGFGKYGLPESSKDTNPYRWIATYRWEIDKMMEIAREMRKIVEAHAPGLRLVSWDPMTGHRPYGLYYWGKVFDVITMQIYPAQGNRDHVGFTTKFYKDLSGSKEVWPVPHIGHFPASFTATEVEEILSQTFRGGATGLHLWTGDQINRVVRGRGSSVSETIGAPERWNVVQHVTDRLIHSPFQVRQPEPDTAIFYSNTSVQGTGMPQTYSQNNQSEWIYTVLGPRLKGALRFVDEINLAHNPDQLEGYKTIYIPFMPIADDAEYDALEAYVMNGGTLIVCDPRAFRNRSDGSERTRGAILPPLDLKSNSGSKFLHSQISQEGKSIKDPFSFSLLDRAYDLQAREGVVLATYDNKEPAVLEVSRGKGKVVFFASMPAVPALITNKPWENFFRGLQSRYGASFDHDIWRFRLPETPALVSEAPGKQCLTDNYFEWSLSVPKPMHNAMVGGSYQLNGVRSGEPAGQWIPFHQGKLTDRIRGAGAKNEEPEEHYYLRCKAETPWSIHFQFQQPASLEKIRIFYGGSLPGGVLEVSEDGKVWTQAGVWKGASVASRDLGKQELVLSSSVRGKQIRLNFEATVSSGFILSEVDIWGEVQ